MNPLVNNLQSDVFVREIDDFKAKVICTIEPFPPAPGMPCIRFSRFADVDELNMPTVLCLGLNSMSLKAAVAYMHRLDEAFILEMLSLSSEDIFDWLDEMQLETGMNWDSVWSIFYPIKG